MTTFADAPAVSGLLDLSGQRILVTGASGNIGRGISARLAEAGADIVVHCVSDESGATRTAEVVAGLGREAQVVRADLGDVGSCSDLFDTIVDTGSPVNAVVNNAGSYPVHSFTEMSAGDWRRVMSANLDSAAYVSQEAIRRMLDGNIAGAIVNIASIEGSDPAPDHAHYATAKAGMLMLTRSCALEYGSKGIRVNAVSPGLIARAGIEESWPEGVERWHATAPLQRMGLSTDVADSVLFLLSPAARWISGVNLVVDGGMSTVSRW